MAHSIPKRNVHSPAAANAPHISLHNLIRKAGGGGGLISCWCWNVEMLPAATGVTIIRGEATLGCPGWLQVQVGLYCYVLILGLARVGGVVLLWAGERHVASVWWTFLAAGDIVCWTLLS